MRSRLQWVGVGAFVVMSSMLPPSLRGACVTLSNGAWLAQRTAAVAQVLNRYASAQHAPWRRT